MCAPQQSCCSIREYTELPDLLIPALLLDPDMPQAMHSHVSRWTTRELLVQVIPGSLPLGNVHCVAGC